MKRCQYLWLASLCLLISLSGCQTGNINVVKSRGVYTTLYKPDMFPVLDAPNSAYLQQDKFGPLEIPMAVITGYEGASVTLELDDIGAGRVLLSKELSPGPGMASFQPLFLDQTGDYKVRILLGKTEEDSFEFSVQRNLPAVANGNSGEVVSQSDLTASMQMGTNDPAYYYVQAGKYAREKSWDLAIAEAGKGIEINPKDPLAYILRASLYSATTNWNGAVNDWTQFTQLAPAYPFGFYQRGNSFNKLGEYDKAIDDLQRARRLFPESQQGTNYYYVEVAEFSRGMSRFIKQPIRNFASYAQVCNKLAWIWATCPEANHRDGKQAVELATEVCELYTWNRAGMIDTLAAAYAEIGDFEAAIKYEELALEFPDPNPKRIAAYQKRLAMYQQYTAYREPSGVDAITY